MKESLLCMAIALFAVLILIYPFKVKAVLHVNALENLGFLAIKVFNIKLFCARFVITKEGKFDIDKLNKKKKKKKDPLLIKSYFMCLANMIHVKKLELFFTGGSHENAYYVSMLCGYVNAILSALYAILLNKYKHIKIYSDIDPNYEHDKLELSASLVISFSLLNMIISIICAYKCFFQKKLKGKRN